MMVNNGGKDSKWPQPFGAPPQYTAAKHSIESLNSEPFNLMQFMLIYILYSLQYVVYCSILLSRIDLQPTWEFLSKRTSCPCRSSVLRLWSEAPLVALVEKAAAVLFSPRQRVNCTWVKDQMIKWLLWWLPFFHQFFWDEIKNPGRPIFGQVALPEAAHRTGLLLAFWNVGSPTSKGALGWETVKGV